MTVPRGQKSSGSRWKPFTPSFLMMISISDSEACHSSKQMKWARTYICLSNTKDKWFWQTHSRNGDHECCFQGHSLNTSCFCFYFRCLKLKQTNVIFSQNWILTLSIFSNNGHISDAFWKLCSPVVNTAYLYKIHSLPLEQYSQVQVFHDFSRSTGFEQTDTQVSPAQ